MTRIYTLSKLALLGPCVVGVVVFLIDILLPPVRWIANLTSGTIDILGWYVPIVLPFVALGFIVSVPPVSLWTKIVKWVMGVAVIAYAVFVVFLAIQTNLFTSFDMGGGILTLFALTLTVPIWFFGSLILMFTKKTTQGLV